MISILLEESKPVKVVPRKTVETDWVCPHCDNIIGEKELYSPDGGKTFQHRLCNGEVELPKRDYDVDKLKK